jgi:hypothetical protein
MSKCMYVNQPDDDSAVIVCLVAVRSCDDELVWLCPLERLLNAADLRSHELWVEMVLVRWRVQRVLRTKTLRTAAEAHYQRNKYK